MILEVIGTIRYVIGTLLDTRLDKYSLNETYKYNNTIHNNKELNYILYNRSYNFEICN